MNAEQFAYWVQGKFEDRDIGNISHDEALRIMKSIKEHVATVFKKVTPTDPVKVEKSPEREVDINELIKSAFPKKELTPAIGRRPFNYDHADYWLKSPGPLPELTC